MKEKKMYLDLRGTPSEKHFKKMGIPVVLPIRKNKTNFGRRYYVDPARMTRKQIQSIFLFSIAVFGTNYADLSIPPGFNKRPKGAKIIFK